MTFSTHAQDRALKDLYSFVEDFRRDRASTKRVRKAAGGSGRLPGKALRDKGKSC